MSARTARATSIARSRMADSTAREAAPAPSSADTPIVATRIAVNSRVIWMRSDTPETQK